VTASRLTQYVLRTTQFLSRIRLWHLIVIFLVLGAWTSVVVPLGEGPDELPHFTVTRYIIQHGRLPDTAEEHESFQPPLYYLLSVALTFWIDTRDFVVKADADYDPLVPDAPKTLLLHTRAEWFPYQGWALAWHLMRLLSLAMGAVTIAAIYATVSALTVDRRLALSCAALLAFLPGFIVMAALVSNDNLAAMLAALVCWRIVLLRPAEHDAQESLPGLRSLLLLGLLLGLGLLSKTSMLAFVPTVGAALLIARGRHRWAWQPWLRANLVVFGTALLVSGWYFVRNYISYGDWLAWPLVLAANEVRTLPLSLRDWLHVGGQAYRSFWLEWIGIALDPVVQLMLALVSMLALLGLARSVPPLWRSRRRTIVAVLMLHCLVIAISWVRWTQTVAGTGQARLFYPALPVIVLALVLGLRAMHPRLPVAVAGLLLMISLLMPLRYLMPAYTPAPRIVSLPSSVHPISATFKDKMRLIGWELPVTRARPGEILHVGLYWEALKDLSEDDWLKIQLLDARDQFVAFKDGSPSAGRDSTDSWRAGERIASWHRLSVPAGAAPGVYRVTVGIHPYGRKNWFPIAEGNMWIALGDQLVLAEVAVE
jgi:4-amino-4-deoxy-L-arabinose transferase-like glycosyltransferase